MAKVMFTNVPLLRTCIGGLCPSLTFLQLGSWVGARGHEVVVHDVAVDREIRGATIEEVLVAIAERVARERPDVLGLSCKVPADGRFTRVLVREVKARLPDVVIVLGGIWSSPCHASILEHIPEVDAVAIREGELALEAICDRVDRGLPLLGGDGDEVPNIATRGPGGELVLTREAPPPRPEEHPPVDLALMPDPDAYTVFPYLTSKGCPYNCTFCAEKIIFPEHVETPLERLEEDLARLESFGRDYFLWLSDPLFGLDPKRLEAIAGLLRRSRFHFLLESRVDILRPEQIELLWEAGCDLIYFGLESASFDTLKRVSKVRTPQRHAKYLRQAKELMAACMRSDITPVFGVINPVPGDSMNDLVMTYDYFVELADIARSTAESAGTDPGYHFYAFDYRFIRGSYDFERLDELGKLGTTWKNDPDDIFWDVVIEDASPALPRAVAEAFQHKIRALVHTTPKGWERLQRSFPPQPLSGLG